MAGIELRRRGWTYFMSFDRNRVSICPGAPGGARVVVDSAGPPTAERRLRIRADAFLGSDMLRPKLGALLIERRTITQEQLDAALREQQKRGGKIGDTLVQMGVLAEETLVGALAEQLEVPHVHLDEVPRVSPEVRARVPLEVARQVLAVPLELEADGGALVIAMVDPQNSRQLELLRTVAQVRIVPRLAGRAAMQRAIERIYSDRVTGPER